MTLQDPGTNPSTALVVDDDPTVRLLARTALEQAGFAVEEAGDGFEALSLFESVRPEIVLLDLLMPNMDGFDTCVALRRHRNGERTPIIVMTALDDIESIKRAYELGATDFVTKPTNWVVIGHRIRYMIRATRAAEELHRSEAKNRALLNAIPDAMFRINREGVCLEVKKPREFDLLLTPSQLLHRSVVDVMTPEVAQKVLHHIELALRNDSQTVFEYELEIEGVLHHREARFVSCAEDEVLCIERDITERKHAEEELLLLMTAIEQAAEGVAIFDRDMNIQYSNPAFDMIGGLDPEEVLGRNIRALKIYGQSDLSCTEMMDTLGATETWASRISLEEKGTVQYFDFTISPVRMEPEGISSYVATLRDVTKEARLEGQLRQAQKMEALGTLSGGIAHDFNNILSIITGYTELAIMRTPTQNSLTQSLHEILKASNRAKDLIKQIITFSRQEEGERKPLHLIPIITETLSLLRASLPTSIEIRANLEVESDVVLTDPSQIHQVLMNLCTNSAHAMREKGGLLEVSLRDVELTLPDDLRHYPGLEPATYLNLTVKDNGVGMERAVMERIFDPFFTTKEQGEGTGMGLATVYGIVTKQGGMVSVESEPGKGSTFHVLFRKAAGTPEALLTLPSSAPPTGKERVLFVDDEEALANVGQLMLEDLGYEVVSKRNPLEALAAFRAEPDRFDLVVTDQTMPDMTGDELSKNLLQIRSDIPIILTTGYSDSITPEKAKQLGVRQFLMKPYSTSELARTVRAAFGETGEE